MNIYILNDVLKDFSYGMVVLAAETKEHARDVWCQEFGHVDVREDYASDFDNAKITVIEGADCPAGMISYVYGGS
jgi:hypothetical protein